MKKIIALLLSCLLLACCASCDAVSEKMKELMPSKSSAESTAQPADTADSTVIVNIDGLNDILGSIKDLDNESAGASLKCAIVSCNALRWVSTREIDEDQLNPAVKAYVSALDEESRVKFAENFENVDFCANEIIAGSDDILGVLRDSGANVDFPSRPENYDSFSNAVRNALK